MMQELPPAGEYLYQQAMQCRYSNLKKSILFFDIAASHFQHVQARTHLWNLFVLSFLGVRRMYASFPLDVFEGFFAVCGIHIDRVWIRSFSRYWMYGMKIRNLGWFEEVEHIKRTLFRDFDEKERYD